MSYLAIGVHMSHDIVLQSSISLQFQREKGLSDTQKHTRNFFSYSLATAKALSVTTTCCRICSMASSGMLSPNSFSASASQTQRATQRKG